MSDSGKDIIQTKNEKSGLVRSLEENLHLHKYSAEKVARFVLQYSEQNGTNISKIGAKDFSRIYSFNNVVFKFSPDGQKSLAVKLFSGGENSQSGFVAESLGKDFLQNSGIFGAESRILLPKNILESNADRLIATEFIDNLDQVYPLILEDNKSKLLVDFLIRLNELKAIPTNLEQFANRSRYSKDSVYEIYQETVSRLEQFKRWLDDDGKITTKMWCTDNNIIPLFESRLNELLRFIDPIVLHKRTNITDLRFNWGDVSFPNMNFKLIDDKRILVPIDMEYAGWDHFSGGISSLLMHHSSEGLSDESKRLILAEFVKNSRLSEQEKEELNARLIATDLLFIARKLKPVTRPAHETKGLTFMRIPYESYTVAKIRMFLEPALKRLMNNRIDIK
ncbi:MAG: hypothetical protein QY322_01900 [bacterium]|nr:MAG: hypothetical protein QY322_01900 [bacterium]